MRQPERRRITVIEFPTTERARECYDSDEYRHVIALRQHAAAGEIIVVEGTTE